MKTTQTKDIDDLREELTKLLFSSRRSSVTYQDILVGCEVCERPLEDERFWDTEREAIIAEQSPITDAILDIIATQKEQLLDRLEEAIGEDTTDDNLLPELRGTLAGKSFILSRNALRTQLRAVLTKEREK